MSISKTIKAQILRYHYVEKWRVGTIARELGVHHSSVSRVLSQKGAAKEQLIAKDSMIIPYLPFIIETLTRFPKLPASRLHVMAQERGYPGGSSHFRHFVSLYRPKPAAEAYLRLRTLPGEQAQVDWGHFNYLMIGQAKRPLMAFVIVLSYSRKIFLRFYLNQQTANFLRGHVAAFKAFGGVPRVCLYDNLKSAVLERQGEAIRFNPTLLDFAAHYRFEPRPVAVARGNEKGRVERAIRYIRDNFFPAREFDSLEDLNQQAEQWCEGVAANRPCPENKSQTVRAIFEQEQDKLMPLPETPYPVHEQKDVRVGKTPYVRFDWNDYSVPHKYVRCTLSVRATQEKVFILNAGGVIAEHKRSYDKAQQIETPEHLQKLVDRKKHARQHRGQNRLTHALPIAGAFLEKAADHHYHLGSTVKNLLQLLDEYGAAELEVAMKEALSKNVPHPNSVRISLQKNREEAGKLPPIKLDLPDDKRIREQVIHPHDLNEYDELQSSTLEEKTHE